MQTFPSPGQSCRTRERRVASPRRFVTPPRATAIAFVAAIAAWSTSALAQPVTAANVTAELVAEHETIRPGEAFTVGISLRPSPGWHTYWRNSGDSGLPTRVEWKLPDGFRAGELEWPHPVRLGKAPLVTFGYEGDVLLLTRIEAPASLRAGSEVAITAAARWLSCRDDGCVPGKADLALRIRVETSPPPRDARWQQAFDAARAGLPRSVPDWSATARESGGNIHIEVSAAAPVPSMSGVQVFPLVPGVLDASADPSVRATDSGFVIEIARDERASPLPKSLGLVLVAEGGPGGRARAISIDARTSAGDANAAAAPDAGAARAPVAGATGSSVAGASDTAAANRDAALPAADKVVAAVAGHVTLWAALGLAFLGGLILNLMPCVFPVLSLKVLGFMHVAHGEATSVRRHGYAFTGGVVVSFWILAGILIALRAAGGALGWGFQLQEPLFVAALAALLLAMALNLFGVFEFGAGVTGAAGRFDAASGYRGSFLSGVLATVLATPCSAPFMGTAIGFALVQNAPTSVAVFTSLGLGMASPYLLLAHAPALIRRLPRPGHWMEHFRQAMAFPLLATVAWLVWVYGQQTGNDGVLRLLLALLLGSMGAWIAGRFGAKRRAVARTMATLCVAAAVAVAVSSPAPRSSSPGASVDVAENGNSLPWLPWDPEAVGRYRSEGRVVFVDFTADWCLSCKMNERVALSGDEFIDSMQDANAVAMKADWTSADPRITEALAGFGRSGVPLYVIYPRDPSREPIVLPQILTPAVVRDALARAVV